VASFKSLWKPHNKIECSCDDALNNLSTSVTTLGFRSSTAIGKISLHKLKNMNWLSNIFVTKLDIFASRHSVNLSMKPKTICFSSKVVCQNVVA